eukprot:PhF_6_TR4865/c0_g1_i1/m.6824
MLILVFGFFLLASAQTPIPTPDRFVPFLTNNRFPGGGLPLSYDVKPTFYWKNVTKDGTLLPKWYTTPTYVPQCNNSMIPPKDMNAYAFETEQLITALGLDIYDGATWCIAMTLSGHAADCQGFLENNLALHKTLQFNDIRGDAACNGIISKGQCQDPQGTGHCGFCYGDNGVSLDSDHALFFREICDIWSVQNTVDLRCPWMNTTWTWNSYDPVLGENAWAQLIAPMFYLYNTTNGGQQPVPDSSLELIMAANFVSTALPSIQAGNSGAFYYGPHNMWSMDGSDSGYSISTENQASLLAGLKGFLKILQLNPSSQYQSLVPQVQGYVQGLKKYLLGAYNKTLGYFVQGALYNATTQTLIYNATAPFATDCQTWVSTVLGSDLIDTTLGAGTTLNLWQTTKAIAGYGLQFGMVKGVGYSNKYISGQVFSGEWSLGAMNWLKLLIHNSSYTNDQKAFLQTELTYMRNCIESELVVSYPVQQGSDPYPSVLYANVRYWIPFGWYANAIPSLSSTAWTVFYDLNVNPLMIDGSYRSEY